MDAFLADWAILLVRLIHLITGIAWIGASFYFVWLDNHLEKPESQDLKNKGVDGELWAVHGGGFYNPQKYMIAPSSLPKNLHWFYWESYSTWLSGVGLFVLVYLLNAGTMLIDPQTADIAPSTAIVISISLLFGSWLIYDVVCRAFRQKPVILAALTCALVVAAAWLSGTYLAPRASFLITGAAMATIMTANVFFWIIPGQRKVIASMRAGEVPDPIHGQTGKQRSVHNTYFTVPVLIAMISNHFPSIYMAPRSWLVLIALLASGAVIRHYFVARHKGKQKAAHIVTGILLAGVAILLSRPDSTGAAATGQVSADFESTRQIINNRCTQCHAEQPLMLSAAPKNIKLETAESVAQYAPLIYTQVVVQKTMPPGNVTEITDDERAVIGKWYETR